MKPVLAIMVRAYRAFSWRPHCGTGHSLPCRLITPHLPSVTCGDKPTWKSWPIE